MKRSLAVLAALSFGISLAGCAWYAPRTCCPSLLMLSHLNAKPKTKTLNPPRRNPTNFSNRVYPASLTWTSSK